MAIAHKIIEIVFAMFHARELYRDPQINYEELVVARNAPSWIRMLEKFGHPFSQNQKEDAS